MSSSARQAVAQPAAAPAPPVRVTRSRRSAVLPALGAVVVIGVLAYLPYLVFEGTTSLLVNFFILLILASMWNLLAGYAGLVSVGQQAFVGLGSYTVLIVGLRHVSPFLGLPLAAVACGAVGLVVWWLLSCATTRPGRGASARGCPAPSSWCSSSRPPGAARPGRSSSSASRSCSPPRPSPCSGRPR
jgi:hypothetical protein